MITDNSVYAAGRRKKREREITHLKEREKDSFGFTIASTNDST